MLHACGKCNLHIEACIVIVQMRWNQIDTFANTTMEQEIIENKKWYYENIKIDFVGLAIRGACRIYYAVF